MSTNYELLTDVRVYLREQVRGIEPDSELLYAWDDFFKTYDDIIRQFAVAGGVRPWQVDHCVQQVWADVVAQLETFDIDPNRRPGRFRSWLYQIVRRTTSKVVREHMQALALILEESEAESGRTGDDHQAPGESAPRSQRQQ